jgi:hypothetical protein
MVRPIAPRALSRAELLEAAVIIETKMMEGESREEIMDGLGYNPDQYAEARKFLLDAKSDEVRGKSREHIYVEYMIEQRGTIKQIDELVNGLKTSSQYNAMVGALRLKTDLVDRIIDRGIDFGFIKKTPERKEIIAGVLIGDMSTADLKKEIMEHGKLTKSLLEKFGDSSFLALPDKPIHYTEPSFVRPDIETEGEELDDEDDLDAELRKKAKAAALAPKKHKKKPPKR